MSAEKLIKFIKKRKFIINAMKISFGFILIFASIFVVGLYFKFFRVNDHDLSYIFLALTAVGIYIYSFFNYCLSLLRLYNFNEILAKDQALIENEKERKAIKNVMIRNYHNFVIRTKGSCWFYFIKRKTIDEILKHNNDLK